MMTKIRRTAVVRMKLEVVSSQRQQYKPYGYELKPTETYIELEIDPETVIESGDGILVLNMDGFKAILASTADAVDEVHDEYVLKARRAGKIG